jgi:hypothetical protein
MDGDGKNKGNVEEVRVISFLSLLPYCDMKQNRARGKTGAFLSWRPRHILSLIGRHILRSWEMAFSQNQKVMIIYFI